MLFPKGFPGGTFGRFLGGRGGTINYHPSSIGTIISVLRISLGVGGSPGVGGGSLGSSFKGRRQVPRLLTVSPVFSSPVPMSALLQLLIATLPLPTWRHGIAALQLVVLSFGALRRSPPLALITQR